MVNHPFVIPQESLNRPVSGSDFGFEIPLKTRDSLKPISGSEETLRGIKQEDDQMTTEDQNQHELMVKGAPPFERKFLHQMSSGFGTQQNDSRGENLRHCYFQYCDDHKFYIHLFLSR